MRRTAAPLSLGLSALLGLGTAQAAVAPALSLEQQARRADLIVRGSLGTPQTVTEGAVTWRVYPLTLSETVVGDAGRLPRQGGEPALYVWSEASDLPQWRTGQDAFFLLYAARLDSPLVGYNQGYYPVVDGAVTLPDRARPAAERAAGAPTSASSAPATMPPPAQTPVIPPRSEANPGSLSQSGQPEPVQPGPGLTELVPPPADEALDAPTRPAPADSAAESLPGLPSASAPESLPGLPSASAPVTPSSPAKTAPSSQTSQPAAQVSVDEFRALLLRARGASGRAGQ